MNVYTQTPEQLTETANQAIDLVLKKAIKKGLIAGEREIAEILKIRVVISDNPNIFSRLYKGLFGDENKLQIHVVTVEKDPE